MKKIKIFIVIFFLFLFHNRYALPENTDELYQEGTHNKSQMLVDMHPDVTTLVHKFNRVHHHVNYRPFKKNKLIRKKDYTMSQKIDNYGMILSTL